MWFCTQSQMLSLKAHRHGRTHNWKNFYCIFYKFWRLLDQMKAKTKVVFFKPPPPSFHFVPSDQIWHFSFDNTAPAPDCKGEPPQPCIIFSKRLYRSSEHWVTIHTFHTCKTYHKWNKIWLCASESLLISYSLQFELSNSECDISR